jgi:hypothetical protein
MKKFTIFALSIILSACCGCEKKENVAIKIGNIPITVREFNDAFQEGRFQYGAEFSRKEFLESYVMRKLILQEAEDLGLDEDRRLLKSLQFFWEQALLKLALARKINEVTVPIKIDAYEVSAFYDAHKDKDYAGKDFSIVQDEIKLILFKEKQQQALEKWMDSLKQKSKITLDYKLLGIE